MKKSSQIKTILLVLSAIHVGCASHTEGPILANEQKTQHAEAQTIYDKAKIADARGKTKKAIRLYDQTANKYPLFANAPEARYRQAQLLDSRGEFEDVFKANDLYLNRYPADRRYSSVLSRQVQIAEGVASGELKSTFLGISSALPSEKVVEMLGKIGTYAPRSAASARAQYTIGKSYYAKKKNKEAIAAFHKLVKDQPDSKEAPEALFKVGQILMEESDQGNRNQSNLTLAKEAFNDYLIQYPNHYRSHEAKKNIHSLESREIQRWFDVAEFYLKVKKYEAAKVYYRDIIKRDTGTLAQKSKRRLKELGE